MYIQHHRQADDLRARFKVPESRAFCHTARLRNRPARLKLVLSDSTERTYPSFCDGAQSHWQLGICRAP